MGGALERFVTHPGLFAAASISTPTTGDGRVECLGAEFLKNNLTPGVITLGREPVEGTWPSALLNEEVPYSSC
jgi:hypothetical protein